MRVVTGVQKQITSVYARDNGLTLPEWRLLARLATSAPMQLSALCKFSGIDKAQAGRILRALEERGLVSMQTDEAHRRRIVVDITPDGRAVTDRVFPIAEVAQFQMLQPLTATERKVMYSALKKMLNSLSAKDSQRPDPKETA